MKDSNIQWTDHTWNIARGCTKVDADCKFCYMYRDSLNETRYVPDQVVRTKTVFNLPKRIKEPSKIFASSLTDFMHPSIDSFRHEALDIIDECPHHTFQVLTKRTERLNDDVTSRFNNVWWGTSVGSMTGKERIYQLLDKVKSAVAFLSAEPLHGPLDLSDVLKGNPVRRALSWVIIGGESGNDKGKYRYRPCELEWIELIVDQCKQANVPVFVKQLGTHLAKQLKLKDRHGGDISEWPEHLRIRQFPVNR